MQSHALAVQSRDHVVTDEPAVLIACSVQVALRSACIVDGADMTATGAFVFECVVIEAAFSPSTISVTAFVK